MPIAAKAKLRKMPYHAMFKGIWFYYSLQDGQGVWPFAAVNN